MSLLQIKIPTITNTNKISLLNSHKHVHLSPKDELKIVMNPLLNIGFPGIPPFPIPTSREQARLIKR